MQCPLTSGKTRLTFLATFGVAFEMGQAVPTCYDIFGLEMRTLKEAAPELGHSYNHLR